MELTDPPTHFFKFIRPGCKFDLSPPKSFLMNLNPGSGCLAATLRRGRQEWSVEIDDGVFGDGWRRFVRENGVQELDFIVFKYQGNMVLDFLVFDQSTCERQYPNLLSEEVELETPPTCPPAFKETSSTLKNHPYFISTLKLGSLKKSFMHLPNRFIKQSGLKSGEMIVIDDKDRSWKIQLVTAKNAEVFHLGRGLRAFLAGNEFKVGDAFKFELVEKEKNKPPIVNFSYLTPDKEDGRRYFIGELKSNNLHKSDMYLPKEFVIFNRLITDKKKLILKNVEDGKLWTVELKSYKIRYFCIGGQGWKEFRAVNGLKEGDCFKLEAVHKGKMPIVNFYLQKNIS